MSSGESAHTAQLWGYLQPVFYQEGIECFSLPLPGSYGREALIRPYLDSCPCRKTTKAQKKPRCDNCKSVKSLATFVPRKLLHFSCDNNGNRLILEISGNNSMEIVHLHRKETTPANNDQLSDVPIEMYNEDEIALQYDDMGISGAAQSLVRFHVIKNESTVVGVASEAEETAKCADVNGEQAQAIIIDRDRPEMGTLKDEHVPDDSSHKIKDDKAADKTIDVEVKTQTPLDSTAKDQSSESEEETPTRTESAPLTMPINFLEATSNPYELSQNSKPDAEQHSQSQMNMDVMSSQTTPQKSNVTLKRKLQDDHNDESHCNTRTAITTDFDKESTDPISVQISSLTYNQIQQLHTESNVIQPSVRNAVLSLTLALTSNASAWDSVFLHACNEKEAKKEELAKTTEKWMPRLLQGTGIVMKDI